MIRKGTKVEWKWGNGTAEGTVEETYDSDIEKTVNGSKVKRDASESNPAYLIKQSDGQSVLKSKSEVSRVN